MIFARSMLLSLVLLGCQARRPQAPDWVRSAPAAAVAAVSFRADWAMEQPRLGDLLESYPLAGRSVDLLLTRARINLCQANGRLTLYLSTPSQPGLDPAYLIQLSGFPDPGKLQVAIANAFAVDGLQSMDNRDHGLFVILDLASAHMRAMVDGEGRVWLGDKAALARLGEPGARNEALAASVAWTSAADVAQGFIRPPELLDDRSGRLPGQLARSLPAGIQSVAWGMSPGSGQDPFNGFELAMTGSDAAVQRVEPWMQRFLAAVGTNPGSLAQPPELLQEAARIGLRCQLSQEQVDAAMARLNQPRLPCR